jgi:hypothetical protein
MQRHETRRSLDRSAEHPQLDLFGDLGATYRPIASLKTPERWLETPPVQSDQPFSELLVAYSPEPAVEATVQFDLFVHSPLDQALNWLRLAILRGSVEFAQQFYQSAQAIDAKTSADAAQTTRCSALNDADICMQFLLNTAAALSTRGQFRWLADHKAILLRFVGSALTEQIEVRLKMLARDPDLEAFDADQPDAYAAQIWFEINEPALANAVLTRDATARSCPQRLQLWAEVCAALALTQDDITQVDATKSAALEHWLTLCFDWPEHAENTLPLNPRFAARWEQFCVLDCSTDISNFPGFSSLYGIPWPAPDADDVRPAAELLRACQALNMARDSAPPRLALKATSPEIFHYWIGRRG